jgi:type VI secretion system protein ImpA
MPFPPNLLEPIPGENPSGADLRYAPVYDKVKEARREDDTAEQGDWKREIKKADWVLVTKLTTDALSKQTKDLQIAAWLTEAAVKREYLPGLIEGIALIRGLLENFWDTVYPLMEDGDVELRSAPVGWAVVRMEEAVKRLPLTKSGLDWFKFKESRAVGSEEGANTDDKRAAREAAIAEGKLTLELFEEDYKATSTEFYQKLVSNFDVVMEAVEGLGGVCDEKFGEAAPTFGRLTSALEEVRQTARILLEPRAPSEQVAIDDGAAPIDDGTSGGGAATGGSARGGQAAEPADRDDAIRRIVAVAKWLRQQDSYQPAPYLILRGLRWGELRAAGAEIDQRLLEAPSSDVRTALKTKSLDGDWAGVLDTAETAMGMPCGRGWLDLQRFAVRACEEQGSYTAVVTALRSELRALLADFPALAQMTMMDDTPTANAETQEWLKTLGAAGPAGGALSSGFSSRDEAAPGAVGEERPPDAHELAMKALRSGRAEAAIEILAREVGQERSGRGRFHRKMQLAGVCLAAGHEQVALPILEEMFKEIEQRKLEEWEAPDLVAQPLLLLVKCMDKLGQNTEERQRVYSRICKLDPMRALEVPR